MSATSSDTGVKPADFKELRFSVVIGGGTAGLTVAGRLATSSKLNVGVLEAGQWRPDDPKIAYPAYIGQSLMDPNYDWCYQTKEQEHANGRKWIHPRGKVMGGSSALNFLVWQRGHEKEFDALDKELGCPGWSWKDMLPFFRKSATMLPPSSELQKANLAGIDETAHGSDGPVHVSYSSWYHTCQKHFMDSLESIGLTKNVDGLRGSNSGLWASPATVDQRTWTRSSSAAAHYTPNKDLPNLKVLCGAHVTQVVLENGRATGVKYVHDGHSYEVKARREVVLSGGSINSPAILEHSGIGSPAVLKKVSVDVKVPLEGVGANLVEHCYTASAYELNEDSGVETWDQLREADFAANALKQYQSQDVDRGIIASAFSGFAYLPLQQYMSKSEVDEVKSGVQKLLASDYYVNEVEKEGTKVYLQQLDDLDVPAMELVFAPGWFHGAAPPKPNSRYFTILAALQHPFSRGTVHITSNDPLAPPELDPRYFSAKADLDVLAKAVKWVDQVVDTPAFKKITKGRQQPAPEKTSDADVENWVKDTTSTTYHPVGTCSMGAKEKGGVVDEKLRVHGVQGLRVVDASVLPIVPSSHIQSVVYGIAEKAASMILEDLAA
ncbi:alcohol oxidase [Jaminaea rosea]|uniref:Alcohol oxidase n=1 Tax=Jaminaea rosea TaxID=1569628 RepID=A0A316UZP8_9BASI|nr:alcohol oxidase [Jaminaea rosea]PWN29781.1 alcohol oxidase [Jaminaea rosea]